MKTLVRASLLLLLFVIIRQAFWRSGHDAPPHAPIPVARSVSQEELLHLHAIPRPVWILGYSLANQCDGCSHDQLTIEAAHAYDTTQDDDGLSLLGVTDPKVQKAIEYLNAVEDEMAAHQPVETPHQVKQ